jgi:hypothetical protein
MAMPQATHRGSTGSIQITAAVPINQIDAIATYCDRRLNARIPMKYIIHDVKKAAALMLRPDNTLRHKVRRATTQ